MEFFFSPQWATYLLAYVLAGVGLACFLAMLDYKDERFGYERTATTLGGGSRTTMTRPMIFAAGSVIFLALAAATIIYGKVEVKPREQPSQAGIDIPM